MGWLCLLCEGIRFFVKLDFRIILQGTSCEFVAERKEMYCC